MRLRERGSGRLSWKISSMAFNDDAEDNFDWAAAVAEIDKACDQTKAQERGGAEASCTQSRAFHQKTLDSFVRGGAQQRASTTEIRAQFGNGRASESSVRGRGKERSTDSDFRLQNVKSSAGGDAECGCHLPVDEDAAKIWIYPANVPRRSYQFDITKSALFCNTLVCLPTGLGKTLIAAVVMYNFFRWFPTGKIVFTAPSRPLVVQQIEACHKVTGIPQNMTIDMTGQMNPVTRAEHWQSRRVFFVTPQVLEKDIQSGRCTTKQLVCLVVDEAHRATGNYSYCVVVRELLAAKVEPRILALSATPGSKQNTIQAVLDNLQISCLEYRDEHDPDVTQYTHNRQIELIEVAMNAELNGVKDVFVEVLQPVVDRLCYLGVLYSRDYIRLTPYELLTARDKFRQAPPAKLEQSRYPEVETYFGLAITLTHIFKLLFTHGMRPALEMLQDKLQHGVLKRLATNEKLHKVLDLMRQSVAHGAPSPKLDKVVDIITRHFNVHDPAETRVIIFTNFRESVKDIMGRLAAACASVKAMEFIGQSSGKTSKGQTQKTQQAVLQRFRGGCYNTIVATSIAEEGLDIMEVDLVICFDANISPLRMIQRMGRTGRNRDGRVVVLASSGSEIQGYLKKQSKNKVLGKHMLNGGLQSFNFQPSHHMIPHSLQTTVQFVELAIEDFVPRGRKLREKDSDASVTRSGKLTERELEVVKQYKDMPAFEASMISFPQQQSIPTPVHHVKHSARTCMLIDALQTLQNLPMGEGQRSTQEKDYSLVLVENISPHAVDEIDMITTSGAQRNLSQVNCGTRSECQDQESIAPKNVFASSPAPRPPSIQISSAKAHVLSPVLENEIMPDQILRENIVGGRTAFFNPANVAKGTKKVAAGPCHTQDEDSDFDQLENSSVLPTAHRELFGIEVSGDGKANLDAQFEDQHHSSPMSDGPPQKDHQLDGPSFHRCRYSTGVVSVLQSCLVLIASPPSLLLSKKLANKDQCNGTGVSAEVSQQRTIVPSGQRKIVDVSSVPYTNERHSFPSMTPVQCVPRSEPPVDCNLTEPDEKTVHSLPKEAGNLKEMIQKNGVAIEQLSPDLAEFAEHGLVLSTPATKPLSCKSSGEDWQVKGAEASVPQKLKRLRKAHEKLRTSTYRSAQDQHGSKLKSGTAKNQRKLAARVFIDEEAEASSDDDSSENDVSEDEDEDEVEKGFIDNEATQRLNGSVDMMEVYRRSLLTPSPVGDLAAKKINLQHQDTTPSSNVTAGSSMQPPSATASLDPDTQRSNHSTSGNMLSSFVSGQIISPGAIVIDLDRSGSTSAPHEKCSGDSCARCGIRNPKAETLEDGKKAGCRKRKLSFQVSPNFKDDFFEGVDLDALEAEAAELSRARNQGRGLSSKVIQDQNVGCPGASKIQGSGLRACTVLSPSQLRKDDDFLCFPTFDLGLGD